MNESGSLSENGNFQLVEMDGSNIRYNPSTETYHTVHDWSSESLSNALIHSIEAITELEVNELPPLYEQINPDALDQIFQPIPQSDNERIEGRISFPYAGFLITVHGDGEIVYQARSNN